MRKLWLVLLVGGALTIFTIPAPAASAGRVWTYQYLLTACRTERELAPITEHIIKEEALHVPELIDTAAEVLLARQDDAGYPPSNRMRLVRVLGAAETGRYNAVLARVADRTADRDLAKSARWIIAQNKSGVAEYAPGSVDIHALVADMDAAALAARPTTTQGEHLARFPGGSIDALFEWAGRPQQIVSGQTRITTVILPNVKVQRLTFYYRGLGRVVYGYSVGNAQHPVKEWLFQAIVADPLAFEEEFSYRDHAQELGMPDSPRLEMMQLVSGYTASMKTAVETNYRRASSPLEFMDTAAEILATQFKSANDPVTVDNYAWICRLLTMHGGRRYAAILERVATETSDSKLGKFARLRIESVKGVPSQPYLPGSVSLAAQRAKYPPLYPESTFQSGRL